PYWPGSLTGMEPRETDRVLGEQWNMPSGPQGFTGFGDGGAGGGGGGAQLQGADTFAGAVGNFVAAVAEVASGGAAQGWGGGGGGYGGGMPDVTQFVRDTLREQLYRENDRR